MNKKEDNIHWKYITYIMIWFIFIIISLYSIYESMIPSFIGLIGVPYLILTPFLTLKYAFKEANKLYT